MNDYDSENYNELVNILIDCHTFLKCGYYFDSESNILKKDDLKEDIKIFLEDNNIEYSLDNNK